jgi:hypothetical protein
MKKSVIFALAILFVSIGLPTLAAWSATQTLNGVVSDSMCGKKHMMPGKSDAQCVQECVKAGSKYVLVVGEKIYTLDAKMQTIAPFAGKHVLVQGELKGATLSVQSIHESAKR